MRGAIFMWKRKVVASVLLLMSLIVAYLVWPTDEHRIRKLFKEGVEAAESGDLEGVMAKVSFNYRDDYGVTYLYLKEILKREFQRLSDISVEYDGLKILVREDEATAELDMRVIATAGNETGYIIGDARAPLHIRFTLEKERGKWQIIKTEGLEIVHGARASVR